jgi:hypothetical protein
MTGVTRLALLALCLAAAGGLASAGPARTACTPGVISFDGSTKARVFCGPAKATIHVGGKTLTFKNGSCERTSKYVSVNIGTVVLGPTTKKKPDYFGIDVGQIPGSTAKPAAKDGTYTGGAVAIVSGGKSYAVRGDTVKITLGGNRSKGTLAGTLIFGGSGAVTGSFSC